MIGLSFFGVTPGFVRKDISLDPKRLGGFIQACEELYTLDQFTVRIPRNGSLNAIGGGEFPEGRISFIAHFRHAVEYRGDREGGYYGVGLWVLDGWLDGAGAEALLTKALDFLASRLVDERAHVVRIFDDIDWTKADPLLDELAALRRSLPPSRADRADADVERKLLIIGQSKERHLGGSVEFASYIDVIGTTWGLIANRVLYFSFDPDVTSAIQRINRIRVVRFADLQDESRGIGQIAPRRPESKMGSEERISRRPPLQRAIPHRDDHAAFEPADDDQVVRTPAASEIVTGPSGATRGAFQLAAALLAALALFTGAYVVFVQPDWISLGPDRTARAENMSGPAPKSDVDRSPQAPEPKSDPRPIAQSSNESVAKSTADNPESGADGRISQTRSGGGSLIFCGRTADDGKDGGDQVPQAATIRLAAKLQELEAKLARPSITADRSVSLTRADLELVRLLVKRERAYQACIDQLR